MQKKSVVPTPPGYWTPFVWKITGEPKSRCKKNARLTWILDQGTAVKRSSRTPGHGTGSPWPAPGVRRNSRAAAPSCHIHRAGLRHRHCRALLPKRFRIPVWWAPGGPPLSPSRSQGNGVLRVYFLGLTTFVELCVEVLRYPRGHPRTSIPHLKQDRTPLSEGL